MDEQKLIKSLNNALAALQSQEHSIEYRVGKTDQILRYLVSFLSEKENLFLSSYYAKISYLANQHKFSGRDIFLIHYFRRLRKNITAPLRDDHFDLGCYCISVFLEKCLDYQLSIDFSVLDLNQFFSKASTDDSIYIPHMSVHITAYNEDEKTFQALDSTGVEIRIQFEEYEDSEELLQSMKIMEQGGRLPAKLGLFNVNKSDNIFTPQYYVLEPDFLVDVTSVSEAFDAFGVSVAGYGLKKMIAKGPGLALHVGNLANLILDEMIYDPFISFNHFKNSIFQVNPLAFCSFTNDQVRELLNTVHNHYTHIKRVIHEDFQKLGIDGQSVYVEPSYYAPRIGIQGRFDLLHEQEDVMNIIELKSGKTFKPNSYGLNNSHYHQTLLYDMILESNYGKKVKRNNFILYSSEADTALRYAPTIKAEQREAIKVRNRILLEEIQMQSVSSEGGYIQNFIKKYDGKLSGFKGQDISSLKKIYNRLSPLEKEYWESSFDFLSREYSLSKVGDELSESSKGLSGIWQLDQAQKHERHLLLSDLIIHTDNSQNDDPHILFDFTEETENLSNFRQGDIVILYPKDALKNDQLRSQIFKCTVSELGKNHVILRLRSKQMNEKAFDKSKRWNVEHDILDSSFSKTFRQLYHFAKGPAKLRQRIHGILSPTRSDHVSSQSFDQATPTQNDIINKAISSQDYHLIWGPPGTGKTSVVLKNIIQHYYNSTQTRMLIIAYTNRAVDEICEALARIDEEMPYIRIGSRYSCGPKYKSKLLNTQLDSISNRKELRQLLNGTQVYIGTLASVIGKPEIFELLQFGVCMVDEASQILEASLAGLLTKAKKFILIGDHLQLPAIVLQNPEQAKIQRTLLQENGFRSYAESLFERLYNQCINNEWTWAYSQLSEQGRMHQDIMSVVNAQFYNGSLNLLPNNKRQIAQREWQTENSQYQPLKENRLIYINTLRSIDSSSSKINQNEAKEVTTIVEMINDLFEKNQLDFTSDTIGIITPFRAQIALIRSHLEEANLPADLITIDTVERYQGSARDIIIMSTVVSSPFQLKSLISENTEGIDRKLNVAISRAREQFILIGNEETLAFSHHYEALINTSFRMKPKDG